MLSKQNPDLKKTEDKIKNEAEEKARVTNDPAWRRMADPLYLDLKAFPDELAEEEIFEEEIQSFTNPCVDRFIPDHESIFQRLMADAEIQARYLAAGSEKIAEPAQHFINALSAVTELSGWQHVESYMQDPQLYVERYNSAKHISCGDIFVRATPKPSEVANLQNQGNRLLRQCLSNMRWAAYILKHQNDPSKWNTKKNPDVNAIAKVIDEIRSQHRFWFDTQIIAAVGMGYPPSPDAAPFTIMNDAKSFMKDAEKKVTEMTEKKKEFNDFREQQKKGVQWPHTTQLRRAIENADFVFRPMMIKRDRCKCETCGVEVSGWRPWHNPWAFHNFEKHPAYFNPSNSHVKRHSSDDKNVMITLLDTRLAATAKSEQSVTLAPNPNLPWPEQTYYVMRQSCNNNETTLISSFGLSKTTGVEVVAECASHELLGSIENSWIFKLVQGASQEIAAKGPLLRNVLHQSTWANVSIPDAKMPAPYLDPNTKDCAVILGVKSPNLPKLLMLENESVRLVTLRLLKHKEWELIRDHGQVGRQRLANQFAKEGSHNVSTIRPSYVENLDEALAKIDPQRESLVISDEKQSAYDYKIQRLTRKHNNTTTTWMTTVGLKQSLIKNRPKELFEVTGECLTTDLRFTYLHRLESMEELNKAKFNHSLNGSFVSVKDQLYFIDHDNDQKQLLKPLELHDSKLFEEQRQKLMKDSSSYRMSSHEIDTLVKQHIKNKDFKFEVPFHHTFLFKILGHISHKIQESFASGNTQEIHKLMSQVIQVFQLSGIDVLPEYKDQKTGDCIVIGGMVSPLLPEVTVDAKAVPFYTLRLVKNRDWRLAQDAGQDKVNLLVEKYQKDGSYHLLRAGNDSKSAVNRFSSTAIQQKLMKEASASSHVLSFGMKDDQTAVKAASIAEVAPIKATKKPGELELLMQAMSSRNKPQQPPVATPTPATPPSFTSKK